MIMEQANMKILKNVFMRHMMMYGRRVVSRFWLIAVLMFPVIMHASGQPNLILNVQIPEIALLDIEPTGNNNISMNYTAPAEAGLNLSGTTSANNSLWLNYTCSKSSGGSNRNVYAQVIGNVPQGIRIKLQASPHSAGGGGVFGNPSSSPITLSNTPQALITGIGGCFTGNGTGYGHQLNFTFEITDYSNLELAGNSIIQVSYTIVDH
jgi:hypothetical protein